MSVFDEIKDRINIEDVVAETVRLKKSGRSLTGFCPFHDNHKSPALAVWPETGTWKCFVGCGGGDVFDWVEKRDGLDRRGALELLARRAGVELGTMTPEQFKTQEKRKEAALVAGVAMEYLRSMLWEEEKGNREGCPDGLEYARSRGWTDETIRAAGLGYFGRDWDGLREHLAKGGVDVKCPAAVALVGFRGDVAAWGVKWKVPVTADEIAEGKVRAAPPEMLVYGHIEGRSVVYLAGRRMEGEVKSWNPPAHLFGERRPFFNVCYRPGSPTVVVEGQGDAVTLGQWGMSAVGLCGVALGHDTDSVLSTADTDTRKGRGNNGLLLSLVKCGQVMVGLDDDAAGRAAATGLVEHGQAVPVQERMGRSWCGRLTAEGLSVTKVRVVTWPEKDANDWLRAGGTQEEAAALVAKAPTWLDTLIEFVADEEKDDAERDAIRYCVFDSLAGLDGRWVIERRKKLSKELNVDLDTFNAMLREAQQRLGRDENNRPLYGLTNGCMVHSCFDRMGNPYEQRLLNGVLNILGDVVVDDGEEQTRVFSIEFTRQDGTKHAAGDVDAKDFAGMGWLPQLWGTRAIMPAGQSVKDHLRVATLTMSQGVQTTYRYAHTGWRQVDGHSVFLSPLGAVGMENVNVVVPDPLSAYGIPTKPENVVAAMRASLRFLDVGDWWVTIPMLAAMYHTPLSLIVPPSFTLWLYGTTGTMKSTVVALVMCHYGKFSYNTPPASWSAGTEVGLRTIAFVLKDTPLWIDDFVSQSTIRGNDELVRKADTLLRDWGNRAGGVKGRADGGLRKMHRPRGLIISTAEMLPPGQSITARLFAVEVRPGMITGGPESKLTEAQRNDVALYPHAMGAYIMWLGEHWDELKKSLPMRYGELKDLARQARSHMRGPENVATLAVGFETMMRFAKEIGAITVQDADALNMAAWDHLVAIGEEQQEIVQVEENPVEMFFRALDQMVAAGTIHLRHARALDALNEQNILPRNRVVGSKFIGYYDDDWLYLLPDVSYQVVFEFYKSGGRVFTDTAMGIKSKLKECQVIQVDESERFRSKLRTGSNEMVWTLKVSRVFANTIMGSICSETGTTGTTGNGGTTGTNGEG